MVTQLYPAPQRQVSLQGLYLDLQQQADVASPQVYTNFISSLDGRIAIEQPITGQRGVPRAITNPHDWRLFQELAARADVLLVSARFIREFVRGTAQAKLPLSDEPAFADLHDWRVQQGLPVQPAVVILSSSLDLPYELLRNFTQRQVYVATGERVDPEAKARIEQLGVPVLCVGENLAVDGARLVTHLHAEGYRNIYSIAGPGVLATLLQARVLNRIYLTRVHRMLGGTSYDTLLEGSLLSPPSDFRLQALFYDDHEGKTCGQLFGIYDLTQCG